MGPQSLDVDKNLTHEMVFREDSESGLGLSPTRIPPGAMQHILRQPYVLEIAEIRDIGD